MGTRSLVMVVSNNQTKVAQYGQWDGYPSGVGIGVLSKLSNKDLWTKFQNNLNKVRFLDSEGKDKEFIKSYEDNAPNWSNEPDKRTPEQIMWWKDFCSRDLADDVIENIANSSLDEIILLDKSSFAHDGLFCEWAYVIDLDKNSFEVYSGFKKSGIEDNRFGNTPNEDGYYPVQIVCSFDLLDLPSEFDFLSRIHPSEVEEY